MKTNDKKEKRFFIKVGMLMTLLGIGFVCYMGNSLYHASQQLFEELIIEYVDIPDQSDMEELT